MFKSSHISSLCTCSEFARGVLKSRKVVIPAIPAPTIATFLFIVSIIGNSLDKGLPDISKVFKRKDKIKVNPSFDPLLGFEKCSPQFQEYMRKEIKSGRVRPKTKPQGNFNERS